MAELKDWKTILSSCGQLYYDGLELNESLRFMVQDESDTTYEVFVEGPGPFRVADEGYLTNYWGEKKEKGIGWTFQVLDSSWPSDLALLDVYDPDAKHYVVSTLEYCLEVLATKEPVIRRLHTS